jgi:hypothetical protein
MKAGIFKEEHYKIKILNRWQAKVIQHLLKEKHD